MTSPPREIVLKVSASTTPSRLAGAIVKNIDEGYRVFARAYGSAASSRLPLALHWAQVYTNDEHDTLLSTWHVNPIKKDDGGTVFEYVVECFKASRLQGDCPVHNPVPRG